MNNVISQKTETKKERKPKQKHNKDVPSETIVFEEKLCMCCKTKMKRISATDKYVSDLEKRQRYFAEIYACPNKSCTLFSKRIKPAKFNILAFPQYSYGVDVFAKIGLLRFKEHKNIPEICNEIKTKHSHIQITERQIENIIKMFMVCLEINKKDCSIIQQKFQKLNIKGLVISIDGIEPEKGNDILYVAREVQTGEILFSIYLEFSDEKTIKEKIIEPIKNLITKIGMPVLGWIVDKQLSLTKAIEAVFPNASIQHCQSHFLKEFRKPVRDKDSEMNKDIKKNFKFGE